MIKALPRKKATGVVGENHVCQLYCEKCHKHFGKYNTIGNLLACAPFSILHHYGLENDPEDNIHMPMHTDWMIFLKKIGVFLVVLAKIKIRRLHYIISTSF